MYHIIITLSNCGGIRIKLLVQHQKIFSIQANHNAASEAVVKCDGCGKLLCRECRIFDIWCYGCGHGDAKAFCKACNEDPDQNIWKSIPETG